MADADGSAESARGAHRPVPVGDVGRLRGAAATGGLFADDPEARAELAASTAAIVLSAARDPDARGEHRARLIALDEAVGLDTLAQLWRDAEPDSLPGALWALYLVRAWVRRDGDGAARLWRAGRGLAPADEVVAGVHDDADPPALSALADAVLSGAYTGDFGVALERGASFFRVIAQGRRALAPEDDERELARAIRNERVAEGLTRAARRWRAGTLT